MALGEENRQSCEFVADEITAELVSGFIEATGSAYLADEIPPTIATVFRHGEYALLSTLGVDLKMLLHADQEYTYIAPFQIGDTITVKTILEDLKERKTKLGKMQFVIMKTELLAGKSLKLTGRTTFVVRPIGESKGS